MCTGMLFYIIYTYIKNMLQQMRVHLPCMCGGQAVSGTIIPVDLELLDTVHSLQSSEALQWHFGCACNKLQEFGPVSLVEGS